MLVGIDVGNKGAICWMDHLGIQRLEVMPDASLIVADWLEADPPKHVFVEKAQSMPKQGVASVFSYAQHFGEILGILIALKIKHTLVSPRAWQKPMFAGTDSSRDPKSRALEAARRLFPRQSFIATPRSKKPHEGLIDAALICEYGRRMGVV